MSRLAIPLTLCFLVLLMRSSIRINEISHISQEITLNAKEDKRKSDTDGQNLFSFNLKLKDLQGELFNSLSSLADPGGGAHPARAPP